MVVLGIEALKRAHTVVAVDGAGRRLGVRVVRTASSAADGGWGGGRGSAERRAGGRWGIAGICPGGWMGRSGSCGCWPITVGAWSPGGPG